MISDIVFHNTQIINHVSCLCENIRVVLLTCRFYDANVRLCFCWSTRVEADGMQICSLLVDEAALHHTSGVFQNSFSPFSDVTHTLLDKSCDISCSFMLILCSLSELPHPTLLSFPAPFSWADLFLVYLTPIPLQCLQQVSRVCI